MGTALLRGWLKAGLIDRAAIIDPAPLPAEFAGNDKLTAFTDLDDDAQSAFDTDMIVLAVKPQIMDAVCERLKGGLTPQTPILSIAAGRTLNGFSQIFGETQPIIRAMPNTPAAIGQGVTALIANKQVSTQQKEQATALMSAAGLTLWLEDESLMDAVTALSGSGPAYIFLLIEILARAGEQSGLPADQAMSLARQTVIGAAALAATDKDIPAATLRQNVTSPGGTTQAALNILMNGELQELFDRALDAAATRSRELAQ